MSDVSPEIVPAAGPIETDALIIGAGPAGLFQVFELGLLEIGAHVVDALPAPGGQLIELYPDKPIYDIPGVPRCTARELVDNLLRQAAPFKPAFHLGQEVSSLSRLDDGRLRVETSAGTVFAAKAVVVAAGVGAFQPRRLPLEGLDRLPATDLVHGMPRPGAFAGREVVVAGGIDQALETALALTEPGDAQPRRVTLLHRRDVFQAEAATVDAVRARMAEGRLAFLLARLRCFRGRQAACHPALIDRAVLGRAERGFKTPAWFRAANRNSVTPDVLAVPVWIISAPAVSTVVPPVPPE